MNKIANAAIVATVLLTDTEARRHHKKAQPVKPVKPVDPYKKDPVDLRPALEGIGALYNGFLEGVHGRGYADEECMDKEAITSIQDIVHDIAAGDFNNFGKLIQDGQNAFNGFEVCDFPGVFDDSFGKQLCQYCA